MRPPCSGSPRKQGESRTARHSCARHPTRGETASGADLSPAGETRAKAYVAYFKTFAVDGNAMVPEQLFACADSKASCRMRQTLVPLSDALGLNIDVRFSDEQSNKLASEIQTKEHKKCVLIFWCHLLHSRPAQGAGRRSRQAPAERQEARPCLRQGDPVAV